jgi:hypothetical protein
MRNSRFALFLLLASLQIAVLGCQSEPPPPAFVARVGDQYLFRDDVAAGLRNAPAGLDTADAHRQIVEQWIANTLLYREARRRGLEEDPGVQRLLRDNERSVLISALVARIYDEEPVEPTQTEIHSYYERNTEALRLREPFLRVRYLATRNADSALVAYQLLQRTASDQADTIWNQLVRRFAADRTISGELSNNFYPHSQLFVNQPALREGLARLNNGQVTSLAEGDSVYHLLQLVQRVPPGTIPELAWIRDDIERRLQIQARKQMFARQVQRLRNEALARDDIEVR